MLNKVFNIDKTPKICVLGDIMLDTNIFGSVNKIANEGPLPVLLKEGIKYELGGCGNVLNNLYNLCCKKLYIMSVIGIDDSGEKIQSMLVEKKIENKLYIDNGRKTTCKNRFYNGHYLMFRYDDETTNNINELIEDYFISQFDEIKNDIECLIISDYNKGVCTRRLCEKLIEICIFNNIKIVVDPKNDYYKYRNSTIIKPNRNEASRFLKRDITLDNIETSHRDLRDKLGCQYSVITLAEKGLTSYDGNKYYRSNVESREVVDVTGAGDIVCSVLGYMISLTHDIEIIGKTANYLATISVQHLGTYVINDADILKLKMYLDRSKTIIFDDLKLLDRNKTIVFTNGCFDLLHRGHLECLRYAKNQGDILIVGVNGDSSIKRLKGEKRPIQDEQTRIDILSSLEFINYVIKFDEDTPIKILQSLRPHVIVKGGDYKEDQIIGREYAGEVKIFKYINNISTTKTIEKINS